MEKSSISTLIKALNAVEDSCTSAHSLRASKYAYVFGCSLGLSYPDLKTLFIATYLHDIGKITVDDYILFKKSPLTPSERRRVNEHVVSGFEILNKIFVFREEADLVLLHHERVDGSGYPYGIKGSQIPYLDRIISIVDVFDALSSKRSYKKAYSTDEALKEMIKEENLDQFLLKHFIGIKDQINKVLRISSDEILQELI